MIGETSDPAGGITTLGSVGGVKAKNQSLAISQLRGPASSKVGGTNHTHYFIHLFLFSHMTI